MTPYLDWDNGIFSATTLHAMGRHRVSSRPEPGGTPIPCREWGKPAAAGTRRAVLRRERDRRGGGGSELKDGQPYSISGGAWLGSSPLKATFSRMVE